MVRIKRDGADLQFGGAITDLTRQRAFEPTRAPGSLIGTKRHALIGVFSIANARLGGPPMPRRRHHVQLLVGT